MQNKRWENEYRTTMVCVDSCANGVLSGRFYNPSQPAGERFGSLLELILRMERMLDQMMFPQPFSARRSFAPLDRAPGMIPGAEETQRGAKATFAVRVLFRQNGSWQGSVTWVEGKREESFRSVLELIHLLGSALPMKEQAEN